MTAENFKSVPNLQMMSEFALLAAIATRHLHAGTEKHHYLPILKSNLNFSKSSSSNLHV